MQVDHTENIIELNNVSFSYGEHAVLKNITLNIHKGDYLGMIGPNGSGKSTLLKIMLGLLKPSSGSVRLVNINSKIGYVPQRAANFEQAFPATVSEVVSMANSDKTKVMHALEQVGMSQFKDRLIGDLSGGQQQRVFIARALVNDPVILFLDEPTVGVDIKAQEQFYSLLKKLNRQLHITLILVTHELDVVANEATELACINQTLIYHGTPKEFIKKDYVNKLYGKEVKFILHNH